MLLHRHSPFAKPLRHLENRSNACTLREAVSAILELRRLHRELDCAIRDAYGWPDLDLGHDFHEVETLPENDRVRWTISPAARKEVLKRLLRLNHERAAQEAAKPAAHARKRARKAKADDPTTDLFE